MNKLLLKIFLFVFFVFFWTHCGPPDREDYTIKPTPLPDMSGVKSCHTKFSEQGTSSEGKSDLKSISKFYNDVFYNGIQADSYKVSDLLESLHQDLALDKLVCRAGKNHEFLVLAKIPFETINKITRYLDDFYEKNRKGEIPQYNNKSVPNYEEIALSLFDSNVWREIKNLQDDGIDIVFYTSVLNNNLGQFDPRRTPKPKLAIYPITFSSIFYHEKFHYDAYWQNKNHPIDPKSSIFFTNFILEEFLARLKELSHRKDIFNAFINVKNINDKENESTIPLPPIIPNYLDAPSSFEMGKVYTEKFSLTNTDYEIFDEFNKFLKGISYRYNESFKKISKTLQNNLKNDDDYTKLVINDLCRKYTENSKAFLKQKLNSSQIDKLASHSYAWGRSKTDICGDKVGN